LIERMNLSIHAFTTVDVWCRHRLVTVYVLFVIELKGRRVHFAGLTPSPDEAWIRQVGRNLTDPIVGFVREKRFCLMDRDTKFTAAFQRCWTMPVPNPSDCLRALRI